MPNVKERQKVISIDKESADKLDSIAKSNGVSRTAIVSAVVDAALKAKLPLSIIKKKREVVVTESTVTVTL